MAANETKVTTKDTKKPAKARRSIAQVFREMVAELKKVTWPTKKELINYTIVVVVFIVVMAAVTGLLDALASAIFQFIINIGS